MQPGPLAAVVIATHRRARLLEGVLQDLASVPLPREVEELLVLENGVRDETEGVCRRFNEALPIRYHYVEEAGKSNALNVGLAMTRAELIVFFDDDIRVAPQSLGAFVDAARRHGPGHFFGGPVEPDYAGEPPPSWLRPWLAASVIGWDLGASERHHDEFLGANWAAFRADLVAAGGFVKGLGPNAEFRTVGQEVEMQERLVAREHRGVYVPGARVRHLVAADQCSLRWVRRRWRQQSLSRVMLSPTHIGEPQIAGVPRFLWRQYATDISRALAARLTAPRSDRRMRAELALAVTTGKMLGYRRVRRVGGFSRPTEKARDA
jgi:glycosyltransferase involved in cell wall biosynthesis